jgi:hypothetical protein
VLYDFARHPLRCRRCRLFRDASRIRAWAIEGVAACVFAGQIPARGLPDRANAEISALSKEGKAAMLAATASQREILASLLREGMAAGELAQDTDIDAMVWYYLGCCRPY